jgi:hypothetical protein
VAGFYEGNNRPLDSLTGWERLLAYQNGICSMELANAFIDIYFSYDSGDGCYCAVVVKYCAVVVKYFSIPVLLQQTCALTWTAEIAYQ